MAARRIPSPSLLRALRTLSSKSPSTTLVHRHCLRNASASRQLTTSSHIQSASSPPRSHDRGPKSNESTQTDFSAADIYSRAPPPTNAIDTCLSDGFHLDNGVKISDGNGLLLVGGEAFIWRPWGQSLNKSLVNQRGQWAIAEENLETAWGLLQVVWPRPGLSSYTRISKRNADGITLEMLILGLGSTMRPLAPETRKKINSLGLRIDVQDTRNAAAQFNLLATERGTSNIAAAMIPMGRK